MRRREPVDGCVLVLGWFLLAGVGLAFAAGWPHTFSDLIVNLTVIATVVAFVWFIAYIVWDTWRSRNRK